MNPTDIANTIMVNALPVVIAASVAFYKFIVQFLPAAKHDQLSSLMSNVNRIATQAVQATEQFMSNEAGPVKKAAASNDIAAILNATGIRGVPPELIDHAIEAAVYSMNLFDKPSTAIPAVQSVVPNLVGVNTTASVQSLPGNVITLPSVNVTPNGTVQMPQSTTIL